MAERKTQQNDGDVDAFLESVENDTRRRDAFTVKEIMTRLTGDQPTMWGSSIVGYGSYTYGKNNDNEWFKVGFSPRKQSMTLYIMDGFEGRDAILDRLGPHGTGKSCLYIKDVEKVDRDVLEELISTSLGHMEAALQRGFDGTIPG